MVWNKVMGDNQNYSCSYEVNNLWNVNILLGKYQYLQGLYPTLVIYLLDISIIKILDDVKLSIAEC